MSRASRLATSRTRARASSCARTRALAASLAAVLSFAASAANFPDADGSHDVASAAAWGGTLPGTTDAIVFTNKGANTFTFGSAVTFGAATYAQSGVSASQPGSIVFDQTGLSPVPRVQMTGYRAENSYLNTEFRGGYYDLNNGVLGVMNGGYRGYCRTLLSEGCIITNANSFCGGEGYGCTGSSLVLRGGSYAHFKNGLRGGYGCKQVLIEVSGGSEAYVVGGLSDMSTPSARNYISISNESTYVRCTGTLSLSGKALCTVSDRAKVRADKEIFLGQNSSSNLLTITSGATVLVSGNTVYIGSGSARGNTIEVLDGAVLSNLANSVRLAIGGIVKEYSGGAVDSTLIVSNAACYCGQWAFATEGSTGSRLILRGPKAVLVQTKKDNPSLFGTGRNAQIILENGAVWGAAGFGTGSSGPFSYTSSCRDETVIVRSGATWKGNIMTHHGLTSQSWVNSNNTIRIEADGIFDGGSLRVGGMDCKLVVSNGTVSASAETVIGWGDPGDYGALGTNGLMIVQGDSPKVDVANGPFTVQHASRLRFEIPPEGYASEGPLVRSKGNATIAKDCTLTIAGLAPDGWTQLVKGDEKGKVTLLESAATLSVDATALAAAQAALPRGYKLQKKGKKLILERKLGTAIYLK